MTLQIGELADLFEISTKTLRHYEKLGLLCPERDVNGYRLYDASHVLRVQRIRKLQGLGLSLRQVGRVVDEDGAGDFWKSVLQSLLEDTSAEIDALEARRNRLERLIESDSAELVLDPIPLPHNLQVNAYLQQHLTPAMQQQWRHDPSVYAFVGSLLQQRRLNAQINSRQHEFSGWISAETQPVGIPHNLFIARPKQVTPYDT